MIGELDSQWLCALTGGRQAECLQTHGAWIVLCGDDAFKLKKPVNLHYLDFTSVQQRAQALSAELDLNRSGAPMLYRGLSWLTQGRDDKVELDGSGVRLEPVLRMARFDQSQLLDQMAGRSVLPTALMRDLAHAVRASHEGARVCSVENEAERMRAVLNGVCSRFKHLGLNADLVRRLHHKISHHLENQFPLIVERGRSGFVRRCHGDLHLRNLVCVQGRPVLFDALEFDEGLATIDLSYDLAFLLMDLIAHDQNAATSHFLSWYYAQDGVEAVRGAGLLPLYCALRAMVRAMVALDRGDDDDAACAERHLDLAQVFLTPKKAQLIAIGGLSGTGKSTLALSLAPKIGGALGAVVLRADLERKALAGAAWDEPLPETAYTPAASERVYARMRRKAEALLGQGVSVVMDGVHARPEERALAEALAHETGTAFKGLWLEADTDCLKTRVQARREDPSDADADIVDQQAHYDLGPIDWLRLDAGSGLQNTIGQVERAVI